MADKRSLARQAEEAEMFGEYPCLIPPPTVHVAPQTRWRCVSRLAQGVRPVDVAAEFRLPPDLVIEMAMDEEQLIALLARAPSGRGLAALHIAAMGRWG